MDVKKISIIIAILLTANVAGASIFNEILNAFIPKQPQPANNANNFNPLYIEMLQYNTPQNVNLISGYMQKYGVNVLKVHVVEYGRDIYFVKGSGLTLEPQIPDRTVSLRVTQLREIEGFIADSELSWYEQWRLRMMYRQG